MPLTPKQRTPPNNDERANSKPRPSTTNAKRNGKNLYLKQARIVVWENWCCGHTIYCSSGSLNIYTEYVYTDIPYFRNTRTHLHFNEVLIVFSAAAEKNFDLGATEGIYAVLFFSASGGLLPLLGLGAADANKRYYCSIADMTGQTPISQLLSCHRLRWLGYAARKPETTIAINCCMQTPSQGAPDL